MCAVTQFRTALKMPYCTFISYLYQQLLSHASAGVNISSNVHDLSRAGLLILLYFSSRIRNCFCAFLSEFLFCFGAVP